MSLIDNNELEECSLFEECEEDDEYIKQMEEAYNNGSVMNIESFIATCNYGGFTDDDGYGELLINELPIGVYISPSERNDINPEATHIRWFNK